MLQDFLSLASELKKLLILSFGVTDAHLVKSRQICPNLEKHQIQNCSDTSISDKGYSTCLFSASDKHQALNKASGFEQVFPFSEEELSILFWYLGTNYRSFSLFDWGQGVLFYQWTAKAKCYTGRRVSTTTEVSRAEMGCCIGT
jgi:hypothetical protein